MKCLKCGHIRADNQSAPDWLCSSCIATYNKVDRETMISVQGFNEHAFEIDNAKEENIWPVKSLIFSFTFVVIGIYLVVNYGHIQSEYLGNIWAIICILFGMILLLFDLPYTRLKERSAIITIPVVMVLALIVPIMTASYISNKITYHIENYGEVANATILGIKDHIGCFGGSNCAMDLSRYRYVYYKYTVDGEEYIQADPLPIKHISIKPSEVGKRDLFAEKYKKGKVVTVVYSYLEPSISSLQDSVFAR